MSYVRLARPWEWLKSSFILLPVPFAVADGASPEVWRLIVGVFGFCLLSSAVYVMNDMFDAARDRHHPKKRFRPLAAHEITQGAARIYGICLFLAAAALIWFLNLEGALVLAAIYLAFSSLYSLGAKNIPLVDVFLISSGFVIRVLYGCVLIPVDPSNWLLLCASTLALFLALSKRYADLAAGLDSAHRASLRGYSTEYLRQAMSLTAGIAILSYAFYCMDKGAFKPGREFVSLPFAAFGVLDYLRRATLVQEGGSPARIILTSPSLWIAGAGWLAAVLLSFG